MQGLSSFINPFTANHFQFLHFQGGGGAQKPLWCLDSSCGFVSRKLKKQAIYPQHLWESQPSHMKEGAYLHPVEWKSQSYL